MTHLRSTPKNVGIEVTRRCNLRCPHCFTGSTDQSAAGLGQSEIHRVLTEAVQAGITEVSLCGGEPLLREDLESMMHFGRSVGVTHYSMVSNGVLMTEKRAIQLREAGLLTAQISIDGINAEDYHLVRNSGPAAFYHAIRGIRYLQDAGVNVAIACLLSPHNIERVPEMVLLCQALKVSTLRYCTFVPTGRGQAEIWRDRYRVTKDQLKRFSDFMAGVEARPEIPTRIAIDHPAGPCGTRQYVKCGAGGMLYIAADGEAYPCTSVISPEFSLGNVQQKSLKEILDSPNMCPVVFPKHELSGPCRTCENDECDGGCRGAAFFHSGDIRGAVINCHIGPVKKDSASSSAQADQMVCP